jgi:hypothetical protein
MNDVRVLRFAVDATGRQLALLDVPDDAPSSTPGPASAPPARRRRRLVSVLVEANRRAVTVVEGGVGAPTRGLAATLPLRLRAARERLAAFRWALSSALFALRAGDGVDGRGSLAGGDDGAQWFDAVLTAALLPEPAAGAGAGAEGADAASAADASRFGGEVFGGLSGLGDSGSGNGNGGGGGGSGSSASSFLRSSSSAASAAGGEPPPIPARAPLDWAPDSSAVVAAWARAASLGADPLVPELEARPRDRLPLDLEQRLYEEALAACCAGGGSCPGGAGGSAASAASTTALASARSDALARAARLLEEAGAGTAALRSVRGSRVPPSFRPLLSWSPQHLACLRSPGGAGCVGFAANLRVEWPALDLAAGAPLRPLPPRLLVDSYTFRCGEGGAFAFRRAPGASAGAAAAAAGVPGADASEAAALRLLACSGHVAGGLAAASRAATAAAPLDEALYGQGGWHALPWHLVLGLSAGGALRRAAWCAAFLERDGPAAAAQAEEALFEGAAAGGGLVAAAAAAAATAAAVAAAAAASVAVAEAEAGDNSGAASGAETEAGVSMCAAGDESGEVPRKECAAANINNDGNAGRHGLLGASLAEEARFFQVPARGPSAAAAAAGAPLTALQRLRQAPSAASLRLARELGLCESEDAAQRRWREGERERRVAHALLRSRLLLCTVDA